jgi:hypothetical protein
VEGLITLPLELAPGKYIYLRYHVAEIKGPDLTVGFGSMTDLGAEVLLRQRVMELKDTFSGKFVRNPSVNISSRRQAVVHDPW